MTTDRPLAVVVLAAGKGTRMKSDLPKVLHGVLGRSSLGWVLAAVEPLEPSETVVVVGHGAELVRQSLPPAARAAVQHEQLGTGDAVRAGIGELEHLDDTSDVLVVNGDGALFTAATLERTVAEHRSSGSAATALAIRGDLALPYGRVLSEDESSVTSIVESKDANPAELAVAEMNAGVYCFELGLLRRALPRLSSDNAKGELYLTDVFGIASTDGATTRRVVGDDPDELLGINTRADLAEVEDVLRRRILHALMEGGTTVSMPHTVLVEPTVSVAPGATLLPGTILRGATRVASGAVVGPATELVDTRVEEGAVVERSVATSAVIGPEVQVGPFAYLRPGTELRRGAKAGTFVELKNTIVGARSKVPHLSYVGDASIGEDTNIGAGNITANYRPELGRGKQRTTIGSNVRTGSDCVLVAPLSIGDGAWTGAGSIVVQDVPAGALAIARARQTNIEGYAERVFDGAAQ